MPTLWIRTRFVVRGMAESRDRHNAGAGKRIPRFSAYLDKILTAIAAHGVAGVCYIAMFQGDARRCGAADGRPTEGEMTHDEGVGAQIRAAATFAGSFLGHHPILCFLIAALIALNVPLTEAISTEDADSTSCKLRPVFMENFDDESISARKIGPARWIAHTPWNGDFGDARFIDPGPAGPFKVKDGMLSITASKDEKGQWTSGLIAAADATGAGSGTRYGYFEARMKMPPGPGTWPAFWLAAQKPAEVSDGNVEIDVIEYYGQFTSAYQAVLHIWYKDKAKKRGSGQKIDVADHSLVRDFHTYGVDISPRNITYFLDRKPVWVQPTPPELDVPMYPLVNLALGSGWPIDRTPNPSTLLVDYVHVYGRGAGPPAGCPVGLQSR